MHCAPQMHMRPKCSMPSKPPAWTEDTDGLGEARTNLLACRRYAGSCLQRNLNSCFFLSATYPSEPSAWTEEPNSLEGCEQTFLACFREGRNHQPGQDGLFWPQGPRQTSRLALRRPEARETIFCFCCALQMHMRPGCCRQEGPGQTCWLASRMVGT